MSRRNGSKVMNKSYIETYVDLNGNVSHRKFIEQYMIIEFAGVKFIFDRIFSIIGLVLASPIMLIVAIAIKLDSKGPVLFKQERLVKVVKTFIYISSELWLQIMMLMILVKLINILKWEKYFVRQVWMSILNFSL